MTVETPQQPLPGQYGVDFSGEPEQPVIDLETQVVQPVANLKSNVEKAHYAMGDKSPGAGYIATRFQAGDDANVRQMASQNQIKEQERLQREEINKLLTSGEIKDPQTLGIIAQEAAIEGAKNSDPRFILERMYADKAISQAAVQREDSKTLEEAMTVDGVAADKILNDNTQTLRRQQIALKKYEKVQEELKNTSMLGKVGQFGLQLVPWYGAITQTSIMGNADSFWWGKNMRQQQYAYFNARDDQEADSMLEGALAQLPDTLSKAIYLDFMLKGTSWDEALNNITMGLDVGFGLAFGVDTAARAVQLSRLNKGLISASREAGRPSPNLSSYIEATGDVKTSALNTAFEKPMQRAAETGRELQFADLVGELTGLQNPMNVTMNGGQRVMSNTGRAQYETWLQRHSDRLVKSFMNDPVDLPLANTQVYDVAAANAVEDFRAMSTPLAKSVLNVSPVNLSFEQVQANIKAGIAQQEANALMNQIVTGNKYNQWLDYTHAMNTYRDIAGRAPTASEKTWKGILGKLAADEEMVARLSQARDVIQATSKGDRKLFDRANARAAEGASFDVANAGVPQTRIVKDLGNTPMVGIGLGRSGDAAMDLGHSYAKIARQEEDILTLTGKSPAEKVVIQLGNPHEANLFGSPELAQYWADMIYKLPNYTIQQMGTGFFIEVYKPVDFYASSVQHALKITTQNMTPPQINSALNFITSPAHTLARETHSDRLLTAAGMSKAEAAIGKALEPINSLPGKLSPRKLWDSSSKQDMLDFLTHQRAMPNKDDPVRPGFFSRDEAEFQADFYEKIGRVPTERESKAYWAYVNVNDMEYLGTSLRYYAQKSRLGWETHGVGAYFEGFEFEGKFLREGLPSLREDAGVMILHPTGASYEYIRTMGGGGKINLGGTKGVGVPTRAEAAERLRKYEEQGFRVVQITDYAEQGMREQAAALGIKVPEGKVNFILTKDLSSQPLPYLQVPYRPGGHPFYLAENYVSQPRVSRQQDYLDPRKTNIMYYGDNNVSGHISQAEAKQVAKNLEQARKMYIEVKEGKRSEASLDKFVEKNLGRSGEEIRARFDRGPVNGGWSIDEPFMVRGKNQTLDKANKLSEYYAPTGKFTKMSDSELNMYKDVDLAYGMERGETLGTLANHGSAERPSWRWEPAAQLDPLPTIQKTANDVVAGRQLDDLKFKTAQRYVAEFGDVLKVDQRELNDNPMRWLFEAEYIATTDAGQKMKINAAMNFRRSALEFFNIRTDGEKQQLILRALAMDWTFNRSKGGPASRAVAKILDPWAMQADVNLGQKIKNAAFYGFFALNPSQFFKQAQSAGAVTGSKLFSGDVARLPALWSSQAMFGFLDSFGAIKGSVAAERELNWAAKTANIISGGSVRVEDFKEAWELMNRIGFNKVGFEMGDRAHTGQAIAAMRSTTGKVLELSTTPMKAGEAVGRHAAWFGAYDEWRWRNPGAVLDDLALEQIIDKASAFMGDMTRASSSTYQKGISGIITQLLPYNIKLAETMVRGLTGNSTRITRAEAAGIMTMNAFTYGLPTAFGTVLLGVPAVELARKKALDYGYDPESYLAQQLWYGFIDTFIMKPIYGEHTNFSERYGPGNARFLWDLFYSDRNAARFLAGAGGGYAWDTFMTINPFITYMWGSITGNKHVYKPTDEDYKRVLSYAVAGYNQAEKLAIALNTGNALTRDGNLLGPTTKTEALLKAILGIDPQRFADLPKMKDIDKTNRELQNKAIPTIRRELQLAIKSFAAGNDSAGYLHEKNMQALIYSHGFSPADRMALFPRLMRGMEADVDEVSKRFALKNTDRLNAFMKRVIRPKDQQ